MPKGGRWKKRGSSGERREKNMPKILEVFVRKGDKKGFEGEG